MRRHLGPLWEDEDNFLGGGRTQYGIENVSVFGAFPFVLLLARRCCCIWAIWSLMMWAYTQLVRRHLSPPWEDEDDFWGEVCAQYWIENVSAFRVFAFVLPLACCCCCLWAMEVLVLLLHCLLTRTSFFF